MADFTLHYEPLDTAMTEFGLQLVDDDAESYQLQVEEHTGLLNREERAIVKHCLEMMLDPLTAAGLVERERGWL